LSQCFFSDVARINTTSESPTANANRKNNIPYNDVVVSEVTTLPAQWIHSDEDNGPATKNREAVDELLNVGAGYFVTSLNVGERGLE